MRGNATVHDRLTRTGFIKYGYLSTGALGGPAFFVEYYTVPTHTYRREIHLLPDAVRDTQNLLDCCLANIERECNRGKLPEW